jgi:hypothetical protein
MEFMTKERNRSHRPVVALENSHEHLCVSLCFEQVLGYSGLDELLRVILFRLLNGRHIFEIFFHKGP